MKKMLLFCASGLIIVIIILMAFGPRMVLRYKLNKWANDPPIGIHFIEPEKFKFPDNFRVTLVRSGVIIIKNPITSDEKKLRIDIDHGIIYPPLYSENNTIMYLVAKAGLYECNIYKYSNKPELLYHGYNIGPCSLSPNEKNIAFVCTKGKGSPDHGEKTYLSVLDIDSRKIRFSEKDSFLACSSTPPIWTSNDNFILEHETKGIVRYNMDTHVIKPLLNTDHSYPVVWKDKYLITQMYGEEAFISNLDGTNSKLLFKNQFIDDGFTISPDNKYLACRAEYMPDLDFYIKGEGVPVPGISLFVMNLEDKTFTYYMTNKPNYYEFHMSWYVEHNE